MPSNHPASTGQAVRSAIIAAISLILLAGCNSARRSSSHHELTREQALRLAVNLANQECQTRFSQAPFDTTTSHVLLVGNRWSWGGLDVAGPAGLSAAVSFDKSGADPLVEVYLSSDALQPLLPIEPDRPPNR